MGPMDTSNGWKARGPCQTCLIPPPLLCRLRHSPLTHHRPLLPCTDGIYSSPPSLSPSLVHLPTPTWHYQAHHMTVPDGIHFTSPLPSSPTDSTSCPLLSGIARGLCHDSVATGHSSVLINLRGGGTAKAAQPVASPTPSVLARNRLSQSQQRNHGPDKAADDPGDSWHSNSSLQRDDRPSGGGILEF